MTRPLLSTIGFLMIWGSLGYSQSSKNVILFIASGTGFDHLKAASYYWYDKENGLNFQSFSTQSSLITEDLFGYVTDSSGAASSMTSGVKAKRGSVGLNFDGENQPNLFELARKRGIATGLVTTVPISHGTPAGFAAHAESLADKDEVVRSLLLGSRPNIMMGSSPHLTPEWAKFRGYDVVRTKDDLNNYSWDKVGHLSGQFGEGFYLKWNYESPGSEPRLAEMTKKSLELLSKSESGFFIVIEAGRIDQASHQSDLFGVVHQLKGLESSVDVAIQFAQSRNDTTIIVAGDHETGGLEVGNSLGLQEIPEHQWTSTSFDNWRINTETNVPLYISQPLDRKIPSSMDNTEIFEIITDILSL